MEDHERVFLRLGNLEARAASTEAKVDGIAADVRSLLGSRSYSRGFIRAMALVGAGVSAVIAAVVAYFRG